MAGAYEPEKESSIDLVPEEKKTVNTNTTVSRMSNQLLSLFFWSAPTDTQPKADIQSKRKGKILGFKRHTIDLKMHLYHRSLRFLTTYWVTSLHKLKNVINNNNEGLY